MSQVEETPDKNLPQAGAPTTIFENIIVRESSIHGLGVFADDFIPEGTLIGLYDGPRVMEDNTYVLWIHCDEEGTYGIDGQNSLRYTNHSSKPNTSFEGEEMVALRDILPGEEITFHYGEDWEDELPAEDEIESYSTVESEADIPSAFVNPAIDLTNPPATT